MIKNDRPERADHAVRLKAFTELEQLRVALANRYGVPYPLIDTLDYAVRHALAWTTNPDAVMAVHFVEKGFAERTANAYAEESLMAAAIRDRKALSATLNGRPPLPL